MTQDKSAASHHTFQTDVVLLTAIRVAAIGAGFVTSVLAARLLGPIPLGVAGIAFTVATVAALIGNGGLNIVGIYFLGRDPARSREIASRVLTLGIASVATAAAIVLVAAWAAGSWVALGPPPLIIATAALASGIVIYELCGSVVLGLGSRNPYLVSQMLEGIGSLAAAALILGLIAPTATGYLLSAAIAYMGAGIFAATATHRAVGGLVLSLDRRFTRAAIAVGMRGQFGNVLQFLNLRIDLLLVPLFVDLRAAGIYLIAVRMSEVVTPVSSAASALLFPAVARSGLTHTELTERTIRATILVVVTFGFVIVGLADVLLNVFFGPTYQAGTMALRITMVAMIPLAMVRLLSGDLKGRGRPGLVSIAAGLSLITTIVFDVLLIPPLGIEGAALASCLAYSTGAAALLAVYRNVTGASLGRLVPTLADVRALLGVGRRLYGGTQRNRWRRP